MSLWEAQVLHQKQQAERRSAVHSLIEFLLIACCRHTPWDWMGFHSFKGGQFRTFFPQKGLLEIQKVTRNA